MPKQAIECVWDYPRPAICERFHGHVRVVMSGQILADSNRAFRVLETSHPPTYYIPPQDIDRSLLKRNTRVTQCEWKGRANYFDWSGDLHIESVAWCYIEPTPTFAEMAGYLSFYASKVDRCFVNDELVESQEGDFYGGWITSNIKGPFKGGVGTWGW